MIAFLFLLLAAAFGTTVVEHFVPPLEFLHGARLLLVPAVFFFGALALPFWGMLILAAACGFMTDALTVQVIDAALGPGTEPVVEIALGWSIVLYATLGAVVSGFKPLFLRGRWEIHCLMTGVCTALIVLSEFLLLSVRRIALYKGASFLFNSEIAWRIGGTGLVALMLAPVVCLALKGAASLVGYDPRRMIQEEGD